MPKRSAGLLMYKRMRGVLHVLLVHPGGPFWVKRDHGAWSIPKGEYADGEEPLTVARREFEEELGRAPVGEAWPLGELVQPGRKFVTAFALEGELDVATVASNTFELEWPPKSGRTQTFPEIDRAEWFTIEEALGKILPGQREFIERFAKMVGERRAQ